MLPFNWRAVPLRPYVTQGYSIPIATVPIKETPRERRSRARAQRLAEYKASLIKPPKPIPAPVPPKRDRKKITTHLLKTPEWAALRQRVFERDGRVCRGCGTTEQLQIDHILPKAQFPFLVFDIHNLQVLCWPCNRTKQHRQRSV